MPPPEDDPPGVVCIIRLFYVTLHLPERAKNIPNMNIPLRHSALCCLIIPAVIAIVSCHFTANAADPTATHFDYTQCQGSFMPYPTPDALIATPDSLRPVMVNHVGRHGARYYSSAKDVKAVRQALATADSLGTITPLGRKLMKLTATIMDKSKGRWGALDSLGMAEQRGIASRMVSSFPELFKHGKIHAISSKTPRCVNSMYSFLYQVVRLDNSVDIDASSGPQESALMRPYDVDETYITWAEEAPWKTPLDDFISVTAPLSPLIKLLGQSYPIRPDEARELVMSLYKVLAGLEAMMLPSDVSEYLTLDEYNRLWACNNLRQYLIRTATTLSTIPSEISVPLIKDIIATTQQAVDNEKAAPTAVLRFGHAETLMPLLSQMRLPDCVYLTNYYDTVGLHWQNFHVVPMAANLQIILFRHIRNGRYYVRFQLNEQPLSLNPDDPTQIYIPWDTARQRLERCIPIYEL